jgi:hypothetical protein
MFPWVTMRNLYKIHYKYLNIGIHSISLHQEQCDVQHVCLCTTSSVGMQGVTLPPSAVWMCRLYPFSLQAVCTCKVYPFPPLEIVGMHSVSFSTASIMNMQRVSLSTASSVELAGCMS